MSPTWEYEGFAEEATKLRVLKNDWATDEFRIAGMSCSLYLSLTELTQLRDDITAKLQETEKKIRRKPCPDTCECLCHDLQGGSLHPGKPCPGKSES